MAPRQPTGWGPARKRAAASVTFDHLGEAAAIEQGRWPADAPIGQHLSVTHVLPRVLDLLASTGVTATFFVEGWNAGVYPDALRCLVAAGHEVGYHGWRHESWASLAPAEAADLLDRGLAALGGLGIAMRGFRAPGGSQPAPVFGLLKERGFTYFSLPGREVTVWQDLASLPYEWHQIDAFYYSPTLRWLREALGAGADPLPPERLEAALQEGLRQRVEDGGYLALLFHTQLLDQPEQLDVLRRVVQRVVASGQVWCAPAGQVAGWVLDHREAFPADLRIDRTTWRSPTQQPTPGLSREGG